MKFELRLKQHLALTPRLQQSVKLLQLSALEFAQELQQALASNPFLEEEDREESHAPKLNGDSAQSDSVTSDESADDKGGADALPDTDYVRVAERASTSSIDDDDTDWTEWTEATLGLRDHLRDQLGMCRLSERDRMLAQLIIEALDDDGYLRQSLEELVTLTAEDDPVEVEELQAMLRLVQSFDPIGVAARSVQECLLPQLNALAADTPGRDLAIAIVCQHLECLSRREFVRLQRNLDCSESELRSAYALIRQLDPHPGSRYGNAEVRYIVPDVLVRKVKGRWTTAINPGVLPRVRLNRAYADMFQRSRNGSHGQLTQMLQEARWLMRNIEQRFVTIQRVADAIVARQRRFLDYGEVAMKPLGLRHVAAELGLHESTVSRVTNNKYMATPRGLFEFKYFFSRELATDGGGACSATAIRAVLKEMIAAEDRSAPLTDVRITALLAEQGVQVARRTITKYRRQLQLPSVELRRLAQATC